MSVARGLVISGILIMVLADSLWFAMPVTELLIMIYTAILIRKYTNVLPEKAA